MLGSKNLKNGKEITLPFSSPILNPVENFWTILKHKIYNKGKHSKVLSKVCEAAIAAAQKC